LKLRKRSYKSASKKKITDEKITTDIVKSLDMQKEMQMIIKDDQTDSQSSHQSLDSDEIQTLINTSTDINCEANPQLTVNFDSFDDPLTVDQTATHQFNDFTSFGKMLAVRLRQLHSKRLARNCEIEIMNMMMNAELQDCGEI